MKPFALRHHPSALLAFASLLTRGLAELLALQRARLRDGLATRKPN
jgi:hypothetical protein